MSIKRSLSNFRADTPGILAVALTDLSTGTVLVSESAVPLGQEAFDALAARAAALLSGDNLIAYEADASGASLFLRDKRGAGEALMLMLADTGRDPAQMAEAGAELLRAISEEWSA